MEFKLINRVNKHWTASWHLSMDIRQSRSHFYFLPMETRLFFWKQIGDYKFVLASEIDYYPT